MPLNTPGVYIVEQSTFPNSVVEVASAVPAFVGYTEMATDPHGCPVSATPARIESFAEFERCFGGPPTAVFTLEQSACGPWSVVLQGPSHRLHRSMLHFFQNGGGRCWVVSVGGYADAPDAAKLNAGIDSLLAGKEPTLLVVPEAVSLDDAECAQVQRHMLAHCGGQMKSRFALLDVPSSGVAAFRSAIGSDFLGFGAAYHPWLKTTLLSQMDAGFLNIANRDVLADMLMAEPNGAAMKPRADLVEQMRHASNDPGRALHTALLAASPVYRSVVGQLLEQLNLMPPSPAMAGIYTRVDATVGVWKAPANVDIASVAAPAETITNEEQAELNAPLDGKAVNAIRSFPGRGVLVWGARTLDGNNAEWRYISVRRTLLVMEQSCRLALQAYVFEPNAAATWATVKSMFQNYLIELWKRGALAGATPDDAFSVKVGLGETMTPQDVLDGTLCVTVLVAMVRPAEFIAVTFQQQQQS